MMPDCDLLSARYSGESSFTDCSDNLEEERSWARQLSFEHEIEPKEEARKTENTAKSGFSERDWLSCTDIRLFNESESVKIPLYYVDVSFENLNPFP